MTIPIPYIHHATSLNCINHIQNSISQGTNALPEKFQPVLVKYQWVQGKQLLFLILLGFSMTLQTCSPAQGSILTALLLQPDPGGKDAHGSGLQLLQLLQGGEHKDNHTNEGSALSPELGDSASTPGLPLGQHPPQGSKSRAASVLAFCMGQMKLRVKSGHIPLQME